MFFFKKFLISIIASIIFSLIISILYFIYDQYFIIHNNNFHYECNELSPCCYNINSSILYTNNDNNYFIFYKNTEFNQCNIIWSNNKNFYFTLNSDGIAYIFDINNSNLIFKTNDLDKNYANPFKISYFDKNLYLTDKNNTIINLFEINSDSDFLKFILNDIGQIEIYDSKNNLLWISKKI